MRPGIIHFVVTLEDCLAVGGHFYSSLCYRDSLRAAVLEHYFGDSITNTEHPRCGVAFFKAVCGYTSTWTSTEGGSGGLRKCRFTALLLWVWANWTSVAEGFPAWEELAALVVLIMNYDQLAPLLPSDSVGRVWQETTEFRHDHRAAVARTKELCLMARCLGFEKAVEAQEEAFRELNKLCMHSTARRSKGWRVVPVQVSSIVFAHDENSDDAS